MTRAWLITGASRGIGRELSKRLAEKGDLVYATVRKDSDCHKFTDIINIIPIILDVCDPESLVSLRERFSRDGVKLNGIINNAAILLEPWNSTCSDIDPVQFMDTMATNVLGPIQVFKICEPFLSSDLFPIIINMSSVLGSISIGGRDFGRTYPISKTALNAFTKHLSMDLKGGCVISLYPGWIKTDMGTDDAPLSVEQAADDIVNTISSLSIEHNGKFLTTTGKELPW